MQRNPDAERRKAMMVFREGRARYWVEGAWSTPRLLPVIDA
jgi:hypothetical protein